MSCVDPIEEHNKRVRDRTEKVLPDHECYVGADEHPLLIDNTTYSRAVGQNWIVSQLKIPADATQGEKQNTTWFSFSDYGSWCRTIACPKCGHNFYTRC